MLNILLAIHLIIALLLIIVVLLQRSEGGGLGIGGGGNNGKSASLGKLDGLQRMTWALGAGFVLMSIVLTIVAAEVSGNNSIIDQLDGISAQDLVNENADESPAPTTDDTTTSVPADPNAQAPADPNAN